MKQIEKKWSNRVIISSIIFFNVIKSSHGTEDDGRGRGNNEGNEVERLGRTPWEKKGNDWA